MDAERTAMKQLAYILYGALFHLFRLFPVRKNKVVLFMIHNTHFKGNLSFIYEKLRESETPFRFVVLSKKNLLSPSFWLRYNYHMATAEYLFLNDNFLPLAYMNFSPRTRVIQLWHGVGALKRFGLTTETDPGVRQCVIRGNARITHLFVSSARIIPFYSEALGIPEERIYATGVPVTDFYFDPDRIEHAREHFYACFPELKQKKILLYTPTFRRTPEENAELLRHFDCSRLIQELGPSWAILVRFHPKFPQPFDDTVPGCYNVSDYSDIKELFAVADVLVNDYSSTIVEYALLQKPVLLYAYDLEEYDRGFYYNYTETAPGPIVRTQEELLDRLRTLSFDAERNQRFLALHHDYFDSGSADRILHVLFQESLTEKKEV